MIEEGIHNIGIVGGNLNVAVAITRAANTTQYAVNDVMNNSTDTIPLIYTVSRSLNKGGWVVSGKGISSNGAAGTLPSIDLLLFSSTFTIAADNAAFAPTYAQMQTLLGKITFPSWVNRGGISEADGNLTTPFIFSPASNTMIIYGVLLLQNTYTPASSETLQFLIGFEKY